MLRGPLMTRPPFFSLMSPGFVWTSLTGGLGSGGCEMNGLLKFVLEEHDRYGGGSVMVWAGISAQGKTDLHVIDNGTLTAERYVNEILDVHVRPVFASAIGPDFILMDDNARAHRARITNRYLEQAEIVRLDWPARSLDLNSIEHAWDMLQKAITSRQVQPATVRELREALIEEWAQLPQHKLRRLSGSMRRRCQAVINAHGHHTRY